MAKISKTVANEIAIKLTENLQLKINEVENELKQIFIEESLSITPKEVVNLFNKYPKYFNVRNSGYMHYLGQNYFVRTNTSIPSNGVSLVLKGEIAEKFNKLVQKEEQLLSKKNKLIKEFEETILMLGTPKRLKDNFPEAFDILPNQNSTSVAIDLKDIREKVQQVFNLATK